MDRKTAISTKTRRLLGAGLGIPKTYKLYIGGSFPRTESGRYLQTVGPLGSVNFCRASRKDFRDAVEAARKALEGWAGRTAYNRGQIIYRIAEMMEGRRTQFIQELMATGQTRTEAKTMVSRSVDRIVYYAGWCDKYQQVFSAVNPVASSYFNFSMYEPTGVVALICPAQGSLLGLVTGLMPIIAGGNTCVLLASEHEPLSSISFAETLHTSDVPAGIINILTGLRSELSTHMASHMDVNSLVIYGNGEPDQEKELADLVSHNMKRLVRRSDLDLTAEKYQGPYQILDTQELKTTWHPVGK